MTTPIARALDYLQRAACAIAAASRETEGRYAIELGRAADAVARAKREIEEKSAL